MLIFAVSVFVKNTHIFIKKIQGRDDIYNRSGVKGTSRILNQPTPYRSYHVLNVILLIYRRQRRRHIRSQKKRYKKFGLSGGPVTR